LATTYGFRLPFCSWYQPRWRLKDGAYYMGLHIAPLASSMTRQETRLQRKSTGKLYTYEKSIEGKDRRFAAQATCLLIPGGI
jgi:hypothetical protein